jgi:hypothetical protein
MRFGARVVLLVCLGVLAISAGCSRGVDFFRQYEYEEEMYLALDGSATLYVNASVDALNELRGSSFDTNPEVTLDKAAISGFFNAPGVRVTRVTFSSRNNRQYVHVRMDVNDVRQLSSTKPFDWSTYAFAQEGELFVYRQQVGRSAAAPPTRGTWTGEELVAFRMHIPSKIPYHNAGADNLKRGNILVWEQRLADRLAGAPLELETRMETESILYHAISLFAATAVVVAVMFVVLLWWVVRRHKARTAGSVGPIGPRSRAGEVR